MKRSIFCRGEIRVFGEASYSGIEWLHETVLTKLVRIHKVRVEDSPIDYEPQEIKVPNFIFTAPVLTH